MPFGDFGQRCAHPEADFQRARSDPPKHAWQIQAFVRHLDPEPRPQLVQRALLRGRDASLATDEAADFAEVFGLGQKKSPSTGDDALA
jgi:hypothetical protein